MTINVLAFGIARDILGAACVEIQMDGPASTGELKEELELQYPGLKKLSSYMIAVNNEYAAPTDNIAAGDEIAIIPPVSGG